MLGLRHPIRWTVHTRQVETDQEDGHTVCGESGKPAKQASQPWFGPGQLPRRRAKSPWPLVPATFPGAGPLAGLLPPNVHAAPTWGKARIPVWLGSARLSWELACCPPSVAPSHLPHFPLSPHFPAHCPLPDGHSSLACAWPPVSSPPSLSQFGLGPLLVCLSLPPLPPSLLPRLASPRLTVLTNLNPLPFHSLFPRHRENLQLSSPRIFAVGFSFSYLTPLP